MAANQRDDIEFPKAVKKEGKYVLPWKSDEAPPDGNFKDVFTIDDGSNVPSDSVSVSLFHLTVAMYPVIQ